MGGACAGADDATVLSRNLCGVRSRLNVVIAGPPASGKGTVAEKLVAEYGLLHISTGDMLRAAAEEEDNEAGQQAKELMAAGELVRRIPKPARVSHRCVAVSRIAASWPRCRYRCPTS